MDHEPLAAGARLHSQGAVDRAAEADVDELLGGYIEDELFEEESTPSPHVPAPAAPSVSIEINEATEVAANTLISMYCQVVGGEPDMALTGSIRMVVYELAKVLGGQGSDFTQAIATLQALDNQFT